MLWRDTVELIVDTLVTDDAGDDVLGTRIFRQVFANKKSIRQSEFYQAQSTNLRPTIMFEVRAIDYQDELLLRVDSITYDIIRTYTKNGEILELICQGV